MSNFTDAELEYLQGGERRLARLATIGRDGALHIAPVGTPTTPPATPSTSAATASSGPRSSAISNATAGSPW
jgi:hypothetical protein